MSDADSRTARRHGHPKASAGARFDIVTAGIKADDAAKAPLHCLAGITDIASCKLDLPGRIVEIK